MKDPVDPEPEETSEAVEQLKAFRDFVFSKKVLRGLGLILVAVISWKYTDFFKPPDICNDAQPEFKTTLSINNPNMRWGEFKGLEMSGLLKTSAEAAGIGQSYDMITGKPAETAKKFLLNGFINTFDMKVKGCVDTVTLYAKIKTLSGKKAVLNDIPGAIKLEKKFLSTQKQQISPRKIYSKKCAVKLTVKPIDPMAQGAQVPTGNITMSCG